MEINESENDENDDYFKNGTTYSDGLSAISHLTLEEMNEFINVVHLDNRSVHILAKVNSHLIQCEKCRLEFEKYKLESCTI